MTTCQSCVLTWRTFAVSSRPPLALGILGVGITLSIEQTARVANHNSDGLFKLVNGTATPLISILLYSVARSAIYHDLFVAKLNQHICIVVAPFFVF